MAAATLSIITSGGGRRHSFLPHSSPELPPASSHLHTSSTLSSPSHTSSSPPIFTAMADPRIRHSSLPLLLNSSPSTIPARSRAGFGHLSSHLPRSTTSSTDPPPCFSSRPPSPPLLLPTQPPRSLLQISGRPPSDPPHTSASTAPPSSRPPLTLLSPSPPSLFTPLLHPVELHHHLIPIRISIPFLQPHPSSDHLHPRPPPLPAGSVRFSPDPATPRLACRPLALGGRQDWILVAPAAVFGHSGGFLMEKRVEGRRRVPASAVDGGFAASCCCMLLLPKKTTAGSKLREFEREHRSYTPSLSSPAEDQEARKVERVQRSYTPALSLPATEEPSAGVEASLHLQNPASSKSKHPQIQRQQPKIQKTTTSP